jgi:hypothetical protein
MNNFIKGVIEEKFTSKKQQRFFYAKANDESLSKKERDKWKKMADAMSDDTNFKKIPEVAEDEEGDVEEIVNAKGNIQRGGKATDANTKGITSRKTSNQTAKGYAGQMGTHGVHGTHTSLRYWAESDMSKSLGYDDTLGDDDNFKEAYEHFTKELKLTHEDAMIRLEKMGYDQKLPEDKVRLVENPKKFMKDYMETVLTKKNSDDEILTNEKKDINPIIKRQLSSLKTTLSKHKLTIDDIKEYLS